MITYLRQTSNVLDQVTTDKFGNRIHKDTGDFVIVIAKGGEKVEHQPVTMVKVNNEWLPKQMEFDFG
tara:strand:+ start:291 stop:491 length:201 start_codon:yes stop_codon:yes gene_type:complete